MIPKPIDNMMNDGRIYIPLTYYPGARDAENNWRIQKVRAWARMLAECERKRPFVAKDGGGGGGSTL